VILDSSAVVAILRNEADSSIFSQAIEDNPIRRISAASYLEVCIVIASGRNPTVGRRIDEFFHEAEVVIEPVTTEQALIAREAYRDFGRGSGHPAKLNFGDCFAYALAKAKREPLLCKGDDFVHTDVKMAVASS
jgi:ribonuclease VapC